VRIVFAPQTLPPVSHPPARHAKQHFLGWTDTQIR